MWHFVNTLFSVMESCSVLTVKLCETVRIVLYTFTAFYYTMRSYCLKRLQALNYSSVKGLIHKEGKYEKHCLIKKSVLN